MKPQELRGLSCLPNFPATAAELIRVAGLEAAAAIITAWPGQTFPVPARPGGGASAGRINWARLVEVAGDAASHAIVRHYGGQMLYVPSCDGALWGRTQDAIRARYDRLSDDGFSHNEAVFEIGIQFGIAGRTVERVLKRPDCKPVAPMTSMQMGLF